MNPSLLAHVAPLVLAALLCTALLVLATAQREGPRVRWFMVFSAGLAVWSAAYAAELALPDMAQQIFAAKVQYLGITVVPVAWLLFTVDHAAVPWPRWATPAAFLLPAVTLGLVWSNEGHGLVWADIQSLQGPGFTVLDVSYGPWFWVHVGYSYLALASSAVILARAMAVRPPLFRRQAGILLVASLSPWLGNALYLTGLTPNSLDLTVFGFAVAAFLAGWGVLRWQLLSVGPIARDTLVEGLAEGVAVIDPDGVVVDVNRLAAELVGRPDAELVGQPVEALAPFRPDTLVRHERTLHTVHDGDGRSWECRVDPLRDRRGRFRGWTLVIQDVTRQAEEAAALERARRVAEDTARAQRNFMTNMNHELRTPLNGVLGMLQVLEQGSLDPVNRHYVTLARRSGEQLLELVDRLLDFTSIESGQLALAREPLEPNALARQVTDAHRVEAEEKGLAVHFTPATNLPEDTLGDARRLRQVLDGLVENAVKFTEEGHVHVRVTRRGGDEREVPVRFEVFDTGIGIPEERMDEVFRQFVQVDGSATRRHEGAGIGLSTSQKLVARMQGELRVESTPGRGSRFWFEIPLEREGAVGEAGPAEREVAS